MRLGVAYNNLFIIQFIIMSITGFIFSLVASVISWLPGFGLIPAVLAVILSALGMRSKKNYGLGVAGLIIGILNLLVAGFVTACAGAFVGAAL